MKATVLASNGLAGGVSVPLRGNGYRKYNLNSLPVTEFPELFPSPCGVMVIGNVAVVELFARSRCVSVPLRGNGYRKF